MKRVLGSNYIYSDSLDEMVLKGFTYKGKHYTWNDPDCVYYQDDVDDEWYDEVPEGAIPG